MKTDLLDFLKTGRLGQLQSGLPMNEVEKLLGPPWDLSKGMTNVIWIYGSLEIFEYRGFVEGIYLYYRRSPKRAVFKLPNAIELTGPRLSGRTTLGQFRAMLNHEGISFIEKDFRPVDASFRITIGQSPNAVEAWFTGASNRLYLVSHLRNIPKEMTDEEASSSILEG